MNRLNTFIGKKASWIAAAVCLLCFFWLKNPSNPWDRVINSDGKGYYAYLPAMFIYHDLSFSFIDGYEEKYYPAGGDLYKDFRVTAGKGIANKYFPGLAILWLPFFLVAHLLAFVTGALADGYSMPYQLMIAFSAFVYLYFGLRFLKKILDCYTGNELVNGWVVLLTGLATNLVYYTVVEGSMVHVYDFFLVNAFILLIISAARSPQTRYFVLTAFVLGLIVITRPQNGLVIFSIPFLAGTPEGLKKLFRSFFAKPSRWLMSCVSGMLVLSVPLIIWAVQTGIPFIYTYGEEHFRFFHPQTLKFLFSFEKGWLVYTPLAAISLPGFLPLYKSNKYSFWSLLLFLCLLIYVLSSWWVWHYTSQHSQRVMIDFLAYFAILLSLLFRNVFQKPGARAALILFIGLIVLNFWQLYQQVTWVYPRGPVTASAYFSNFFSIKPNGQYFIPEDRVRLRQSFTTDYESNAPFFNQDAVTEKAGSFSGKHCLEMDSAKPVMLFSRGIGSTRSEKMIAIKAGGMFLKADDNSSIRIRVAYGHAGEYYGQSEHDISATLTQGRWSHAEYVSYLPYIRSVSDSVFVYLESVCDNAFADDMTVELLTMKEGDRCDWFGQPDEIVGQADLRNYDMEGAAGACWKGSERVTDEVAFSGTKSCRIDGSSPYSVLFEDSLAGFYGRKDGYIRVAARIHADAEARPVLVFDYRKGSETIRYRAIPVAVADAGGSWVVKEFFDELPVANADKVRIYFWYTSGTKPCYIDDFEVEWVAYLPKKPLRMPGLKDIWPDDYSLTVCNDFEDKSKLSSGKIMQVPGAASQNHATFCNEHNRFSYALKVPLNYVREQHPRGAVITADLCSDHFYTVAALIADFRHEGRSVSYNLLYLRNINEKGKWVPVIHQVLLPAGADADTLLVYFYLPHGDEQLMADNICVRLLPLQAGAKKVISRKP